MAKKTEQEKGKRGWYEVIKGDGSVHALTGVALVKGSKHYIEHEHATDVYFAPTKNPNAPPETTDAKKEVTDG